MLNYNILQRTLSPLSINFIATKSLESRSRHKTTKPKVPLFKSLICIKKQPILDFY